ncbi:unnamed protein product [Mytilus edulis]|uniref:Uncharacterized protein n=1 Tax=Mytilus edulis TaxID=6550 RepID=A0A8S3UK34_MYTED|nr:unnamed protein product [Mytilus edulis]
MKTDDSHSWFIIVKTILAKYNLPSALHLLDSQIQKLKWKTMVNKEVSKYWKHFIEGHCKLYPSLKYLNSQYIPGKTHVLVNLSASNSMQEAKRIPVKLRIATGSYILMADRTRHSKNKGLLATCPLCQTSDETLEHFLLLCPALSNQRKSILSNIQLLHEKLSIQFKHNGSEVDLIQDGDTPLHSAVCGGHLDIVQLLSDRADIDANRENKSAIVSFQDGDTPLHSAVCGKQLAIVQLLLNRADIDPNRGNKDGDTPLHSAVCGGHLDIVQLLLDRADIDTNRGNKVHKYSLQLAVSGGRIHMVKCLLEREDTDQNKETENGGTNIYFLLSCSTMLGRSVRDLARPQNTAKGWNSWTRDLDNKDTLVFTDGLPDWTGFTTHNATNSTPLVTYICTLNHHRCYLCQPLELCIGMIQLRIFQVCVGDSDDTDLTDDVNLFAVEKSDFYLNFEHHKYIPVNGRIRCIES